MAESPEIRCVFVETDLDTNLGVLVHNNETISDFKKKLCKEHEECYSEVGEINISAIKVKRRNRFYRLADCMILSKAFEGINRNWYMYVDASLAVVDKGELMDADQKCSNHELVETKEVAVILDGYAKNPTPEEDFGAQVADKTSKKRKLKCSDEEESRKKPSVDLNQSASTSTALRYDVDESHALCEEAAQVDVVASESCAVLPRDDVLTGAIGKENEMGEKSAEDVGRDKIESDHVASHPENQLDGSSGLTTRPDAEKVKDADQNCSNHELFEKEKDSLLLNVGTKNPTLEEGFETEVSEKKTTKKRKLKSVDGNKSRKKPSTDLHQSAAPTAAPRFDVDDSHELGGKVQVGVVASESSLGEKLDDIVTGAIGKENEMGEKSVEDVGRDQIETDNIASDPANHLDVSNLEKEKKKRRNKSSKVTTTSRDTVNEINGVPGIVDRVDAEARQKANETVEKSVEDVGRDQTETDSLASHPANHLDANTNSGLTTRTEKKKRRKKSSRDGINQSFAATITSGDIVNEINGVPENVDRVDATSESLPISRSGNPFAEAKQKETEMGEKIDDDVGSGEAIPSAVEIDGGETKSVKSTKKKKSRKAKTLSKEDTTVASGENVEPIKAVDGEEEPDNVIRNVLDSLQERNDTEENLDKIEKKSSKKSKKKHSLKLVESQDNAALEKTPPINSPNDTDAFITPAEKKDTESDALHLEKSTEDVSVSKHIRTEKADTQEICSSNNV